MMETHARIPHHAILEFKKTPGALAQQLLPRGIASNPSSRETPEIHSIDPETPEAACFRTVEQIPDRLSTSTSPTLADQMTPDKAHWSGRTKTSTKGIDDRARSRNSMRRGTNADAACGTARDVLRASYPRQPRHDCEQQPAGNLSSKGEVRQARLTSLSFVSWAGTRPESLRASRSAPSRASSRTTAVRFALATRPNDKGKTKIEQRKGLQSKSAPPTKTKCSRGWSDVHLYSGRNGKNIKIRSTTYFLP